MEVNTQVSQIALPRWCPKLPHVPNSPVSPYTSIPIPVVVNKLNSNSALFVSIPTQIPIPGGIDPNPAADCSAEDLTLHLLLIQ